MQDCKHKLVHEARMDTLESDAKRKVSWVIFVWAIGIITGLLFYTLAYSGTLNEKGASRDVEMAKIQTQLMNIQSILLEIKVDLKDHSN